MTAIKAPNKYENQWGILKNSGDYIKEQKNTKEKMTTHNKTKHFSIHK